MATLFGSPVSYEGRTGLTLVYGNIGASETIDARAGLYAAADMILGYGGADTIYGNGNDNLIFGDQRTDISDRDALADGADILYGYGGDDLLNPGAGTGNNVFGGDGTDTLDYRDATPGETVTIDVELGIASAGTYGSTSFAGIENVWGSLNGPNSIHGDGGANEIHGGNFDDVLVGRGGKDTLYGFDGNDILRGAQGSDRMVGGNGSDRINAGSGNDKLFGGKGKDRLKGKDGDDTLKGQKGEDVLIAGAGSDKLFGGEAADAFVFHTGYGNNRIMDFEADDVIRIGSGANNFLQLQFTDTAAGLRIEFANVRIFLVGLDYSDIDRGNFDFF